MMEALWPLGVVALLVVLDRWMQPHAHVPP